MKLSHLLMVMLLLTACSSTTAQEAPTPEDTHTIDADIYHFDSASVRPVDEGECDEPHQIPWESSYTVIVRLMDSNMILVGDQQENGSFIVGFSPGDFLTEQEMSQFGGGFLEIGKVLQIKLANGSSDKTDISITNCGFGYLQTIGSSHLPKGE